MVLRMVALAWFGIVGTSCTSTAAPLDVEPEKNLIAGTLTAYVTSWFDLDDHFGADVVGSGAVFGLDIRLHDGHHEIKCQKADQDGYVDVRFQAPTWHMYRVICKHQQGGGM